MPQIRPITDLRNTNEISELCHTKHEPIFKNKERGLYCNCSIYIKKFLE